MTGLLEKVKKKKAKIAVIGLGYVGLPTATNFASLGFQVRGIDVNPEIVKQINNCELRTTEPSLQELVTNMHTNGHLSATENSVEALREADVLVVCVQTPLNRRGEVDLSFLEKACRAIAKSLKRNSLIVIQSTVPPKTINSLVLPLLESGSGLKCGTDFWLAYCPERLAPGNVLHDLTANARLIGVYDRESGVLAKALFGLITRGELLTTTIPSAEAAKLAENAFRYVNVSFANELALVCKQIGVDAEEVIKLANTHPRVNIHKPGCGAGGPCLSKDTQMLLNCTKSSNFRANLMSAAIKLNNSMPRHIADIAVDALEKMGKKVEDSKIAIFGTAYKGGVNDSRGSPSKGIVRELKRRHARIVVFDPNCDESFGEPKAKNLKEGVEGADCILIATDHKEFCSLDLDYVKRIMKKNPIIVDGKRIINPATAKSLGFEYVAISSVNENSKTLC